MDKMVRLTNSLSIFAKILMLSFYLRTYIRKIDIGSFSCKAFLMLTHAEPSPVNVYTWEWLTETA